MYLAAKIKLIQIYNNSKAPYKRQKLQAKDQFSRKWSRKNANFLPVGNYKNNGPLLQELLQRPSPPNSVKTYSVSHKSSPPQKKTFYDILTCGEPV